MVYCGAVTIWWICVPTYALSLVLPPPRYAPLVLPPWYRSTDTDPLVLPSGYCSTGTVSLVPHHWHCLSGTAPLILPPWYCPPWYRSTDAVPLALPHGTAPLVPPYWYLCCHNEHIQQIYTLLYGGRDSLIYPTLYVKYIFSPARPYIHLFIYHVCISFQWNIDKTCK